MASIPIYSVLRADATVRGLLGDRIYGWGQAPEGVTRPYLVWQVLSGLPANNLSSAPGHDSRMIQVDIYATTSQSCEAVAIATRDVIEVEMNIIAWYGEGRDGPTDDYRFTYAVDWFTRR